MITTALYAIPRIIINLVFQIIINVIFTSYLVTPRYLKIYKILSYVVFIGYAISLPIIFFIKLFSILASIGAPDAIALSMQSGFYPLGFWCLNTISMTVCQIIFNKYFLKRLVDRNSTN